MFPFVSVCPAEPVDLLNGVPTEVLDFVEIAGPNDDIVRGQTVVG
jgi:hypothetical protein